MKRLFCTLRSAPGPEAFSENKVKPEHVDTSRESAASVISVFSDFIPRNG